MLPNADRAVVDIAKLHDYCLNPNHEDGGRLFVDDFIEITLRSKVLDRQDPRRFSPADDVLRDDLKTPYGTDSLAFVSGIDR
jgi:hypothetical protein